MKLCVFQGTFNPIHKAHLKIADYVIDKYNFDKLIFIPAFWPPHKDCDLSLSYHRLNMVKLATDYNKKFEVSDIEYRRQGKSYTYLTICELYKLFDVEGKINFIIGTDAFDKIESWYEAQKLKNLVKFLVFVRELNFNENKYDYLRNKGYDFEYQQLPFDDISSSDLRKKLCIKENCEQLLSKKVKEYIEQNDLYQS